MVAYYDQQWRLYALRSFGLAMAALILTAEPVWIERPVALRCIQLAGATLVIGAVLGRLWATLYIGGRKNSILMTRGPYSVTRNPLYFFSTVGSVGAGLTFGSVVLGGLAGVTVGAILFATSRGEAELLQSHFGERYDSYARRVPLFWPRPCLYEETSDPAFHPQALKRALGDSILFLLVIPGAQLIELLRSSGWLPRLLVLV